MRVEVKGDIVASGRDLRPTAFKGASIHQVKDGLDSKVSASAAATTAPARTINACWPCARRSIRTRWWARQPLQTRPWRYVAFVRRFKSSHREAIRPASNAAAECSSVLARPQTCLE